jgi:hypothetical protein
MHRLSVKLHLACRERKLDELHLQCRINGAEWRPVCSVWGGDVFCSSRFLSKLDMHRLSVQLHLTSGERSFDQLHL